MSAVDAIALDGNELPAALADVVDAFHDATVARFEQMEERVLGRAKGAALSAVLWGVGIVASLTCWACANVALGLWLSALHSGFVAVVVASVVHGLAAVALVGCALATSRRASRVVS